MHIAALLQPHPFVVNNEWITVYTHGLFFAVGAEVAVLVGYALAKRLKLPYEDTFRNGLIIFLCGLAAARVGFFISYPSSFVSLNQVFSIWNGGLVSYWGLAGGILAAVLIARRFSRADRIGLYDVWTVAVLAGWSVGRIGNYYAADSTGVTSGFWHLFYGKVPIQLFESVMCLILTIVGWRLLTARRLGAGWTALVLAAAYCLGRFVIDFWRDESFMGLLHVSQIVSLVLLLVLLVLSLIRRHAR